MVETNQKQPEKTCGNRSSEYAFLDLDNLPVVQLREHLRQEIRLHSNFVLIGETGSGKTTCLPPLLLELRDELGLEGGIAVTQPRRVATKSITERVAGMMESEVGDQVGYHVRFENITNPQTDITFMTDGILLRKIQFDPLLTEYSVVMIDEAHERSLNIDLCLGLLKDVNKRRQQSGLDQVRVVITSATIERNRFASYIGNGDQENSVAIEGKVFPVQVSYEDEVSFNYDFTQGAAEKVKSIIDRHLDGDILIFMPGKQEIADTVEKITSLVGEKDIELIPLHSEMQPEDQDRIFEPMDKRKIIVATNIAETSITIDGIIHVIDSGLIKQNQFNPRSGTEQLILTEHALSGLEQRKGRAGRTAPGYCYRLFSEDSLKRRPLFPTPEIQRSNLAQVILAMKKVGIRDIEGFDFLDHPGKEAIRQALKSLNTLGALDDNGQLTEVGEWLVELSLEPHLGRMIIEALKSDLQCVNAVTIIASFLDGKNIFVRPSEEELQLDADRAHHKFQKDAESDFDILLNVWKSYEKSDFSDTWAKKNYLNEKALAEARNVRQDILDVLEAHDITFDVHLSNFIDKNSLGKAIAAGLLGNLMQSVGRSSFRKIDDTKNNIFVHPGSILFHRLPAKGSLIISNEIFISPRGKTFACNCLEIKRSWLKEIAPDFYRQVQSSYPESHHHSKGKRHFHRK
ncbi:MAG TPA: ATP-dependent RNA helicase [Candidatus Woesebacteria bacterium]|nr:ATP-dependent RNA helicase [Candidatus Woesebacteria bacterium]